MTVTTKLKKVLYKVHELSKIAEEDLFCADRAKVARALVALGLCRQAKEQVGAACQNLGFSIKSLPGIPDDANPAADDSTQKQLEEARMDVVTLVTTKFGVSKEAVHLSITGFAEECAVMAAIMAGRADQYLQAAPRKGAPANHNKITRVLL